VSLSDALEGEELPPFLGRTVYRLVQEALTNARKHASGQVVAITIDGDHLAGVTVEVVNRPRVGHARGGDGVGPAGEARIGDGGHVGSGTGLVGLTERVTLAGGQLTTEVLPDGGFRLSAVLPWSDPEADEDTVA
jgi:signal transduction histidine kinase